MIKLIDLLHEGVNENKDLQELANQAIEYFTKRNYQKVKKWRESGINENNLDFNEDIMLSGEFDSSKLSILSNFVEDIRLSVVIDNSIWSNGVYKGNGKIRVSAKKCGFISLVEYNIKFHDDDKKAFKTAFGAACRETLVHEFQHAYDDFRSSGKYASDKKSKEYYKNKVPVGTDYKMPPEVRNIYLQLPHEYWARLAPILSNIPTHKSLLDAIKSLKNNLVGWDVLDEKSQRRLIKAVSSYYYKEK
tara:strand:+ start:314 stop:1054 length:741 start_codon:yes stop_codon:yes gene_type:complete